MNEKRDPELIALWEGSSLALEKALQSEAEIPMPWSAREQIKAIGELEQVQVSCRRSFWSSGWTLKGVPALASVLLVVMLGVMLRREQLERQAFYDTVQAEELLEEVIAIEGDIDEALEADYWLEDV